MTEDMSDGKMAADVSDESVKSETQKSSERWRAVNLLRSKDAILLAALLLLICAVYVPVILSVRPLAWQPPSSESFGRTVYCAFQRGEAGKYHPTTVISLASDYFSLGKDNLRVYPLHSLFGLLCKTVFLWLLLRSLCVGKYFVSAFALLAAFLPGGLEVVLTPDLRGRIALGLFSYAALWFSLHLNSRHWKWWMTAAAISCFVALGASPWAGILVPAIPAVAFQFACDGQTENFPWKRLIVPEVVAVATFLFVLYMS